MRKIYISKLVVVCSILFGTLTLLFELNTMAHRRSPYGYSFSGNNSLVFRERENVTEQKTPTIVTNTTISAHVLKKLDTIYEHVNTTAIIFPAHQTGKYLMLNPNICRDASSIDIIIIVHTAPGNFEKRDRMRKSFANKSLFLPYQVRIAFLLGKSKSDSLGKRMELEHLEHNDTIMGDFYDHYHNLTLKGVMGFHWVSTYCPNSKVVLKIDDDVIIDMHKLLTSYLSHMKDKKKSIFCNVWLKNMFIMRQGKWKIPDHVFSKLKLFPYYYCSGFTVLLTTDLMAPLYEAAKITPFFWVDDLYLFGMLPKIVGGVTYNRYSINKIICLSQSKFLECVKNLGDRCEYISTLVNNKSYWDYWRQIQNSHNKTSLTVQTVFEP